MVSCCAAEQRFSINIYRKQQNRRRYAGEGDDMNRDIEFLEETWIRMLDAGMIKSKGQFSALTHFC